MGTETPEAIESVIARVRELESQATPGEWRHIPGGPLHLRGYEGKIMPDHIRADREGPPPAARTMTFVADLRGRNAANDAALIAHYRKDALRLAEECERRGQEIERLQRALDSRALGMAHSFEYQP